MMFAAMLALSLAASEPPAAPAPPVLIMVRTSGSPVFEKNQAGLHDELTLLLDGFMILNVPIEVEDFPRKSLAEQWAAVLPLSRANEAVAVVWMAEPMPGQLMLHLVAISTGRTLVRTLDFDRKSRSASTLALMLRELLGTAFLFERTQTIPAEVREVVREVRAQLPTPTPKATPPPPAEEPQAPPSPPRLRVAAMGALQAAVFDPTPALARFGGALGVSVRLGPLNVGVEAGLTTVSTRISPTASLISSSLTTDATLATYFGSGSFLLGPRLAVGAEPSWTRVSGTPSFFSVGPRASVGLEILGGKGPFRVVARLELEGRLREVEVTETTSGFVVWRLPLASFKASLGVVWEGF